MGNIPKLALALAFLLAACSAPPAPEAPKRVSPLAAIAPAPAPVVPARFQALPPSASPVSFERTAKYPDPGWAVPRSIRVLPGGTTVTYLASEKGDDVLSLHAWDLATGTSSVLLRAADLASSAPLSREEELRRERRRERAEGITSYRVAKDARLVVLSHGGDVLAYEVGGVVTRLTSTPEPEIDPQPCASGARVAWVRKGELVVHDRAAKKETVLTSGATEGLTHALQDFNGQEEFGEESGFWWSPKCDRIAYLEVDERHVASLPVAGHRNGEPDLMMQRYPRAGAANPKVRLGIVDLATKKTTWVSWPEASERYLVRLAWTDDGKALHLQALSRDQRTRTLVRVEAQSGKTTALATETSAAWVSPSPMRVLSKRGVILFTSDASGHRHLELRRASDGAVVRTLTSGDWDVTGITAVDETRVVFTATREGPLERHAYAVSLEGGDIERLTRDHGVHALTSSESGDVLLDVHSARDRLPRVDVLRPTPHARTLAQADDAEAKALGVRVPELVRIPRPGGEALHGALLRPRTVGPGEKHPAIVMVYGGPTVQTVMDAWAPRLFWQHLADRGFFVFQLDNRGTTGRGPAFERLVHGRLGELELEDQLAGAAWLASTPEVDPARVGIYGHSYGGFMAATAMLKAPGRFAAGVASAPVTDWRLYDTAYTERYMGLPASNPKGYEEADLARFADKLAGKLFLVHANMDENVHYAHSARLIDALVAAHKPFDLLVLPGERHGYRRPAARAYVNERVAAFFASAL